jgi:prepilin-type N-terminal cleavage/methylation domain-containing protein
MKPSYRCRSPRRCWGMTLIELLIVIAIIGLLIQLILPAVEMSREASRRTQCANHVRQLAMGVQSHIAARGYLPAGGWSWQWVGDSQRGSDEHQPGGWIYNALPYLEQQAVHDSPPLDLQSQSLPIFHCPSRRIAKAYPNHWRHQPRNVQAVDYHARTDYAANGGDVYTNLGPGPASYEEANAEDFQWPEGPSKSSGIAYCRSAVLPAQVVDGMSNTYLIGEKYLAQVNYKNGIDDGDDFTMYQGDDMDIVRWALPKISDLSKDIVERENMPRADDKEFVSAYAFGSAHPSGWQSARCDGSVHLMSYDLDDEVHRRLGNRADGGVELR